jgi:prevent-host-death family protein
MSKTVAAEEFEAHSLELLEEVAEKQEEVVVLKDGRPIGKLVPMTRTTSDELPRRRHRTLEELRGSVTILGDIVEPFDDDWDCMKK